MAVYQDPLCVLDVLASCDLVAWPSVLVASLAKRLGAATEAECRSRADMEGAGDEYTGTEKRVHLSPAPTPDGTTAKTATTAHNTAIHHSVAMLAHAIDLSNRDGFDSS